MTTRALVNRLGEGVYRFRNDTWEFRSDFDTKWVESTPLASVSYDEGVAAIGDSDVATFVECGE